MPLRYPNGITTARKGEAFGEFILPDPSTAHVYKEDFNYYDANDWDVIDAEGSASLIDVDGGVLSLTTDASAGTDTYTIHKLGRSFSIETGKRLWFECRVATADISNFQGVVGLSGPIDDMGGPTRSIEFSMVGSVGRAVVFLDGVTFINTDPFYTLENNVFVKLSFVWDGINSLNFFVDNQFVLRVTDLVLSPSIISPPERLFVRSITSSSANLDVDYVITAKER